MAEMTDKEKEEFTWYKTTEGYLKKIDYKEAWKQSFNNAKKEDVAKTLELPNFDYKLFEEISGITEEMFNSKLGKSEKKNPEIIEIDGAKYKLMED